MVQNIGEKVMLNEVKINLVEAKYYSCNPASGRVMEKAGMKYDATLRNRRIDKSTNENVDLIVYSIMNNEL